MSSESQASTRTESSTLRIVPLVDTFSPSISGSGSLSRTQPASLVLFLHNPTDSRTSSSTASRSHPVRLNVSADKNEILVFSVFLDGTRSAADVLRLVATAGGVPLDQLRLQGVIIPSARQGALSFYFDSNAPRGKNSSGTIQALSYHTLRSMGIDEMTVKAEVLGSRYMATGSGHSPQPIRTQPHHKHLLATITTPMVGAVIVGLISFIFYTTPGATQPVEHLDDFFGESVVNVGGVLLHGNVGGVLLHATGVKDRRGVGVMPPSLRDSRVPQLQDDLGAQGEEIESSEDDFL